MALVNYSFTALLESDAAGQNTAANQAVSVKLEFDNGLATIYSDAAGTTPIAQPGAVTDSNGVLSFWVLPGYYKIESATRVEYAYIDDGSRLQPDTLAYAQSQIKQYKIGEFIKPQGRATKGDGGAATWEVIAKTTENGFNIVTGDATRSFQIIEDSKVLDVRKYGEIGAGNDTEILQYCVDNGSVLIPVDMTTTDRILVTRPSTYIFIAENTTINMDGWMYPGSQTPFGQLIHITADNCGVVGGGESSVIQLGVTDATAVGFLHCDGGLLYNFKVDGNKDNNVGITDDSFQNAVNIINHTDGNPDGVGGFTVSSLYLQNFLQYGMNIYGNAAKDISISDCIIKDMGVTADPESVGSGIVCTVGVSDISIADCKIYGNKTRGLYLSSAGTDAKRYSIKGNQIYNNGLHGISITEESNLGSGVGKGMDGISVVGNTISGNAQHGILVGTYDSVGYVRNVQITGNTVIDNGSYGLLVQTNNHATDRTSKLTCEGNNFNSNNYGIGVGSDIDRTVKFGSNNTVGNTTASISNSGSPSGLLCAFTPTVFGSTGAGTATYSAQVGSYIIKDEVLEYSILLDYNTFTGTGDLKIGGLPVAVSSAGQLSPSSAWCNGLTLTGQAFVIPISGGTTANVDAISNGSQTPVLVDAAAAIRVSGSYFIEN